MVVYDELIVKLLILCACSLFVLGIFLLMLVLNSVARRYYQRIKIVPPKESTSLVRMMSTILRVCGLMILVGLLVLSSIVLLRYISGSRIWHIGTDPANIAQNNITPNTSVNLTSPANLQSNESLEPSSGPALKSALSGYGGYVFAGLAILIILLLILRRIGGSAAE
jgi:hypothetical protein